MSWCLYMIIHLEKSYVVESVAVRWSCNADIPGRPNFFFKKSKIYTRLKKKRRKYYIYYRYAYKPIFKDLKKTLLYSELLHSMNIKIHWKSKAKRKLLEGYCKDQKLLRSVEIKTWKTGRKHQGKKGSRK